MRNINVTSNNNNNNSLTNNTGCSNHWYTYESNREHDENINSDAYTYTTSATIDSTRRKINQANVLRQLNTSYRIQLDLGSEIGNTVITIPESTASLQTQIHGYNNDTPITSVTPITNINSVFGTIDSGYFDAHTDLYNYNDQNNLYNGNIQSAHVVYAPRSKSRRAHMYNYDNVDEMDYNYPTSINPVGSIDHDLGVDVIIDPNVVSDKDTASTTRSPSYGTYVENIQNIADVNVDTDQFSNVVGSDIVA